jgi:hypothetical protein
MSESHRKVHASNLGRIAVLDHGFEGVVAAWLHNEVIEDEPFGA